MSYSFDAFAIQVAGELVTCVRDAHLETTIGRVVFWPDGGRWSNKAWCYWSGTSRATTEGDFTGTSDVELELPLPQTRIPWGGEEVSADTLLPNFCKKHGLAPPDHNEQYGAIDWMDAHSLVGALFDHEMRRAFLDAVRELIAVGLASEDLFIEQLVHDCGAMWSTLQTQERQFLPHIETCLHKSPIHGNLDLAQDFSQLCYQDSAQRGWFVELAMQPKKTRRGKKPTRARKIALSKKS